MEEEKSCIVCKSKTAKYYMGEIKNIDVILCEKHKDYCDNCEKLMICEDEGSCLPISKGPLQV